ncbi:MAG: AMP-binding protein, partial [Phycisphaerae bacterium]|nr:AMP-binding protein [Phycisphaerae bacterium]
AVGLGQRIDAQAESPRVGILAPTSTAAAAAVFACWYAGRTPVPLNFLLAPDELAKVALDAEIDLVVTIDKFTPILAPTGLKTLVLSAETLAPGAGQTPDAKPEDLGALIYTSGTTALPKGAELTFNNLVENTTTSVQHAQITPDQVFLGIIPQFHGFGFTTLTVLPLVLGASVHYLPRFTPTTVVNTIAEKKVSVFVAIASMFTALVAMKNADPAALETLYMAVSGGEPLSQNVAETFEQRWGKRVYEGYGMTEASPVVSLNTPRAYRLGSVGTPLPGLTIEVRDDRGQVLPQNQEGEIVIRGHCVMRGYRNNAEATAAAIRDGALHTGDMGRVDDDGFIHITGRLKDLIIVGGENVYPREIENVLSEHVAVAEVAVIGQQDDVRGEVPIAFVELHEGQSVSEQELHKLCRDRLAGYKTPRQIRIVMGLPRGATGKVSKQALRQREQ